MSKKSRFWRPFEKDHGKGVQTVFKSEPTNLWHIYWSIWRQLNWKKFLLVIWKIFGLFVNTLTPGHKFSLLNRDKWTQLIKIQFSKKQKAFSPFFFSAFLKYRKNFGHFQNKDDSHSWSFSHITDYEKRC